MENECWNNLIAKSLGWTQIELYEDNAGPSFYSGLPPSKIGTDESNNWTILVSKNREHIPNYAYDLNACRAMLMSLSADELHLMDRHLAEIPNVGYNFLAKPSELCEAYLKTKKLITY